MSAVSTLGLLSVATASTGAAGPDAAAAHALGAFLLKAGGGCTLAGVGFAVGSSLYSCLFLRARNIRVLLAWLGVLASGLLGECLPLQLAGLLPGHDMISTASGIIRCRHANDAPYPALRPLRAAKRVSGTVRRHRNRYGDQRVVSGF